MLTQTPIPNHNHSPGPRTAGFDVDAIRLMPRDLVFLVEHIGEAHPGRTAEAWIAAELVLEGFVTPNPAGSVATVDGSGASRTVTFAGRAWSCPCSDRGAGPCIHELAAALAVDEVPAGLVTRPAVGGRSSIAARTPKRV